jgi:hypothetical protein
MEAKAMNYIISAFLAPEDMADTAVCMVDGQLSLRLGFGQYVHFKGDPRAWRAHLRHLLNVIEGEEEAKELNT